MTFYSFLLIVTSRQGLEEGEREKEEEKERGKKREQDKYIAAMPAHRCV